MMTCAKCTYHPFCLPVDMCVPAMPCPYKEDPSYYIRCSDLVVVSLTSKMHMYGDAPPPLPHTHK